MITMISLYRRVPRFLEDVRPVDKRGQPPQTNPARIWQDATTAGKGALLPAVSIKLAKTRGVIAPTVAAGGDAEAAAIRGNLPPWRRTARDVWRCVRDGG